jgi:predicted enzyme related to lactoylglutathione lyase
MDRTIKIHQNKEFLMNHTIQTIIYPVTDLKAAKAIFAGLLGVKPYMDEAYYVGFRVGGQDIGLDPNGHAQGMTMPIGYYHVEDIHKSLQALTDAGAQIQQEPKDVGGEKLTAIAKDADDNLIGLIQSPKK